MTVLASGIILYRPARPREDPRLLLLRNADDGHWGFPKGRRDPDDAHELVTALREVREETGYDGLRLHRSFRRTIEYRVEGTEDDGRRKRVVYFLACAPTAEPVLSPEHAEHRWADRAALRDLLPHDQLRELALHAFRAIAHEDGAPTSGRG